VKTWGGNVVAPCRAHAYRVGLGFSLQNICACTHMQERVLVYERERERSNK
jgi:hypothetical protein